MAVSSELNWIRMTAILIINQLGYNFCFPLSELIYLMVKEVLAKSWTAYF